jgi:predicted nucleic acid-binding protein
MRAVSDTSVLSSLASLGRIDLLEKQFGEVSIPAAVRQELHRHPHPQAAQILRKAIDLEKIKVRSAINLPMVAALMRTLDRGEAEAIALASEMGADFLLVDEREGREFARRMGLRITGTLGVLRKAKADGDIPSLKAALATLREECAFSLAPDLVARALQDAGEV